MKEELCEKVVELRRLNDRSCVGFLRGCSEVDLWVCFTT